MEKIKLAKLVRKQLGIIYLFVGELSTISARVFWKFCEKQNCISQIFLF